MGRLQALTSTSSAAALACTLLCGCNDKKPSSRAPIARREAVIASGTQGRPAATPSHAPTADREPRTLCTGASLSRTFPEQELGHGEAAGVAALDPRIRVGHGRWVWINLWAAWCGPCKEELPRLLQWSKRLSASLDMEFVSLDDDQRQFLRFLAQQPADGLRASRWLPDGKTRTSWMRDLGIDESPELPVQILVNPAGKVHCIIRGAVEDSDFARVAQITAPR
jgi:thiol-disulfide isomerase/thioredoxin